MRSFVVTHNGQSIEVRQDDDGTFIVPDEIRQYCTLGTALKPAWEPIILARKPLDGTVAENVQEYGCGALNIDACRIPGQGQRFGNPTESDGWRMHKRPEDWQPNDIGRWPANVIHDGSEEVLTTFPDAPGQQMAVGPEHGARDSVNVYGDYGPRNNFSPRLDSGSAARFFYCAKASKADREEGCEQLSEKSGDMLSNTSGQHITRRDGGAPGPRRNNHPTVKPTKLMRYLLRLVTPPDGIVLDPFMGSGSTGKAARREGFGFIGIEIDREYAEIAHARICGEAPLFAHDIVLETGNTAPGEVAANVTGE